MYPLGCSMLSVSGQIVGEHAGTTFPFCFRRGNAIALAYTTSLCGRGVTPREWTH